MDTNQGLVRKILACGQTGAELAALDVAVKLGLGHGGWAPRGLRNEEGSLPDYLDMRESPHSGYPHAMEQNIVESDGTLLITRGVKTPETRHAVKVTLKHHRQLLHVDLSQQSAFEGASLASSWFALQRIETVFVTGPPKSLDPKIYHQVKKLLETAFYLGFVKTGMDPRHGQTTSSGGSTKAVGDRPPSVDHAVVLLKKALPLKERTLMANMQPDELESLRSGLGEYIKQNFGLYAGNPTLMEDCMRRGHLDRPLPDEACAVILRALWKDLQSSHKLRRVK